jgi:hypothetical protein
VVDNRPNRKPLNLFFLFDLKLAVAPIMLPYLPPAPDLMVLMMGVIFVVDFVATLIKEDEEQQRQADTRMFACKKSARYCPMMIGTCC